MLEFQYFSISIEVRDRALGVVYILVAILEPIPNQLSECTSCAQTLPFWMVWMIEPNLISKEVANEISFASKYTLSSIYIQSKNED